MANEAFINHTIPSLSGGVSQQFSEARFESQVKEMINCVPTLSRGILRRNPIKNVKKLLTSSGVPNIKCPECTYSYSYDRGTGDEQYLLLINKDSEWYMYNANTGELKGSGSSPYLNTPTGKDPVHIFECVTIGDYTFVVNKTKECKMNSTLSTEEQDSLPLWTNKHIYWIKKTTSVVTNQYSKAVSKDSTNKTDTGNLLEGYTYTLDIGGRSYSVRARKDTRDKLGELNLKTIDTYTAGEVDYKEKVFEETSGLTTTKVTKYKYEYTTLEGITITSFQDGSYWTTTGPWDKTWDNLPDASYFSGTSIKDAIKKDYDKLKVSTENVNIDTLTAERIANAFSDYIAGASSKTSFVYSTIGDTPWEYSDTYGDEASLVIDKSIPKSAELPAQLPTVIGDKIVMIDGSLDSKLDNYYMRYDSTNHNWSETVKPGIVNRIDEGTMPHTFVRQADGTFTLEPYTWSPRTVGDEVSIEEPSFIGKEISTIFFHKNRLGMLTKDSIVLSETGEYGNYFGTTVQSLPDDDPIDILVATTDVTVLRDAVSAANTLILFSDDAQFTLNSLEGVLTPSNANVSTVSSYTYSDSVSPTSIGNKVYFISESGGCSHLFAYRLAEGLQSTEAQSLTDHIPSYIPSGITSIVGHSVLGYIFMRSYEDRKKVYVLSTATKDNKDIQNAFHKWEFTRETLGLHIINNKLYILFFDKDSKEVSFGSISLEVPSKISDISYIDENFNNTPIPYTSKISLSEFMLRDKDGLGTKRGRLQIKTMLYTTTKDSKFSTTIYNDRNKTLSTNTRKYYNDAKVTVMGNAENTLIEASNNDKEPTKGFEIATINIEALFHQRSQRY